MAAGSRWAHHLRGTDMIELYDADGDKVAEIRDRRLVSMEGDCLAVFIWEADAVGECVADMAQESARYERGWLVDMDGRALACDAPGRTGRVWQHLSLADWAYGRARERA